ncbi:hypothetical protein WDU94_013705 [Cyamophila willieti]
MAPKSTTLFLVSVQLIALIPLFFTLESPAHWVYNVDPYNTTIGINFTPYLNRNLCEGPDISACIHDFHDTVLNQAIFISADALRAGCDLDTGLNLTNMKLYSVHRYENVHLSLKTRGVHKLMVTEGAALCRNFWSVGRTYS